MKRNLTVLIFLILPFVACEKASFKDAPLLNTKWVLSSIQDTKTNVITNVPNNLPQEFVIFSDSSNALMVAGACNGCGGSFLMLSSDSIKVTNLTCTARGCANEQWEQWEQYYTYSLYSMFKFKIVGNNMTIYSKGSYNLNFTAE